MKEKSFPFYSLAFSEGTSAMSFEDRGKYISILCEMHRMGRMKEDVILFLVGSMSEKLRSKFKIDEKGLWYNVRLEKEIGKNISYKEPKSFLLETNSIRLDELKAKSGLNEEDFDFCFTQWSLSVEKEGFEYTNDTAKDSNKLIAGFNKWLNTWLQNLRSKKFERKSPYIAPALKVNQHQVSNGNGHKITEAEYEWKQLMYKQFENFKVTGILVCATPTSQMKEFQRRGLFKVTDEELESYFEKAKENVISGKKLVRLNPRDHAELRAMTQGIQNITEDKMGEKEKNEVKQEMCRLAIEKYYSGIEKLVL